MLSMVASRSARSLRGCVTGTNSTADASCCDSLPSGADPSAPSQRVSVACTRASISAVRRSVRSAHRAGSIGVRLGATAVTVVDDEAVTGAKAQAPLPFWYAIDTPR